MKTKKFIVGLNHGCEVGPTLAHLTTAFPYFMFGVGRDVDFANNGRPKTSSDSVIYMEIDDQDFRIPDWDAVKMVAAAFRDGYEKGYDRAATEAEKLAK